MTVLEGKSLMGSNNGANRHVSSNFSLPASGLWKLGAYVGDNIFGTVIVKVYE
ncbi:hypothetical protein [Cytobacillus purgationiresistens]|uniref:DUF1883 domain-containing protein n=1 Tax=Cytobacillus purgationiresistens TaxID=863449 RepID=A0ABU0AR84_9BACI|nr:hypothetical protein [Cytobacillus purgationiresistens]MDQ0273261.1 hypothetical protein [Cytobacillus purgationiresistens]